MINVALWEIHRGTLRHTSLYFLSFFKNNQKNQALGIHSVCARSRTVKPPSASEFPSAPCSLLRSRKTAAWIPGKLSLLVVWGCFAHTLLSCLRWIQPHVLEGRGPTSTGVRRTMTHRWLRQVASSLYLSCVCLSCKFRLFFTPRPAPPRPKHFEFSSQGIYFVLLCSFLNFYFSSGVTCAGLLHGKFPLTRVL